MYRDRRVTLPESTRSQRAIRVAEGRIFLPVAPETGEYSKVWRRGCCIAELYTQGDKLDVGFGSAAHRSLPPCERARGTSCYANVQKAHVQRSLPEKQESYVGCVHCLARRHIGYSYQVRVDPRSIRHPDHYSTK
jgi:hypothetical protein